MAGGKGLEGRNGAGLAEGQGGGVVLCTLTRFLKPSMRMTSAVKMRLAALRTSQADDAIAMTATCSPAHMHTCKHRVNMQHKHQHAPTSKHAIVV